MIPHSLRDAIEDPAVQGTPLDLFTRCFLWLEPHGHRPLVVGVIARQLRLEERTVSRALQLLCETGYLERGPDTVHGVRTYRLLVTRAA